VSRFLLDTTFIIDHLRGDPAAIGRLRAVVESGDLAFVNDVVSAEAWAGAPSDDDHDLTALLRFLEFIAAGPDHAKQAGRWRANARAGGRELSIADALIGAGAAASRATVLTRNAKDFALMPVSVESY
jgi:hypothetical protein